MPALAAMKLRRAWGGRSLLECEGYHGFLGVVEFGQDFGFEVMRDGHLACFYNGLLGADEAELAMAERGRGGGLACVHADRRAEDAAGHGAPGVNIAATCGRVKRGAGGFVGESLEAILVLICLAEAAGGKVAGKLGAILCDPGLGAALDVGGQCRGGDAQGVHSGAQSCCIEGVDGEGAVAARRAAGAAHQPGAGTLRGRGQGGIDNLHQFRVARGQSHGAKDTVTALSPNGGPF